MRQSALFNEEEESACFEFRPPHRKEKTSQSGFHSCCSAVCHPQGSFTLSPFVPIIIPVIGKRTPNN
eukprot:scaffold2849_cov174-Amphora_coffeaeformis.AAC.16